MNEPTSIDQMLEKTGALLSGHFRLSSGLHSSQYVQCARLLSHPRDAAVLGSSLAAKVRSYDPTLVVAPALGGLIIGFATAQALAIPMVFTERRDGAMVLRRGFEIPEGSRVVVVEDVVTTGKSTRETDAVIRTNGGIVVSHASIMNRSGTDNPFDEPYEYLHRLDLQAWSEEHCPLCSQGVPLDAPGSRFQESP